MQLLELRHKPSMTHDGENSSDEPVMRQSHKVKLGPADAVDYRY